MITVLAQGVLRKASMIIAIVTEGRLPGATSAQHVSPTWILPVGGCPAWMVRRQIRVNGPAPFVGSEHAVMAIVQSASVAAPPGGCPVHADVESYSKVGPA